MKIVVINEREERYGVSVEPLGNYRDVSPNGRCVINISGGSSESEIHIVNSNERVCFTDEFFAFEELDLEAE